MAIAKLALQDGTIFTGKAFGASVEIEGEVVFNTAMTGYQEVLTDPSYAGQIVVMTYPLIGNYGVNDADVESRRPWVSGFVVRERARRPSNYRSEGDLDGYLKENGIPGIEGIDTRALVHVRTHGAMPAILSAVDLDDESLRAKVRALAGMTGQDLVRTVSCEEAYDWNEGEPREFATTAERPSVLHRVAAIDCGIKRNILRLLWDAGFEVRVFPATASKDEIRAWSPDGLFLSNGPGDPEPVTYVAETVRGLIDEGIPTFGICLGHQILALACGAKTYKLKFGHRGGNQPVKDLSTGKVEITSQNHGFAVDRESLAGAGLELTHLNLNDDTVEGFRHRELPAFAVQYHPEASPGPHDSRYLFARFRALIEAGNTVHTGGPTDGRTDGE